MASTSKKIAILTFHSAKSYGAVLQTYALCKFLRNKGFNVLIINLRPPAITGTLTWNPISWISAIRFGNFERKYFKYFPFKYRTAKALKENPPIADYYIVGSDQVWNSEITNEYQSNYFFDFVPDGKKLISYAASFGKSNVNIEDENKRSIQKLLNRFQAISVREASGVVIAKEIFEVVAKQVLDPTFLLSDYSCLTGNVVEKKHLVCVKFKKDQKFYETVRKMADSSDLLLEILDSSHPIKGMKVIPKPSVKLWLKTIKSASFVITDSFHGVAFCIIFQKNFIVIPANISRFTRIENLLKALALDDRIFYSYDEMINDKRWLENIDYQSVLLKLDKLRAASAAFLDQALV